MSAKSNISTGKSKKSEKGKTDLPPQSQVQESKMDSSKQLSLGKVTGEQTSAGNISIRFSATAAEEERDDDLTIGSNLKPTVGSSTYPKSPKPPHSSPCNPKGIDKKSSTQNPSSSGPTNSSSAKSLNLKPRNSQSAPPSEVTTPVTPTVKTLATTNQAAPTQHVHGEEQKGTLLAGFRKRISDRIPEPLSQVIEKLGRDNSVKQERTIRNSISLDSSKYSECLLAEDSSLKDSQKYHSMEIAKGQQKSPKRTVPNKVVKDCKGEDKIENLTDISDKNIQAGSQKGSHTKGSCKRSETIQDKSRMNEKGLSMTMSGLLSSTDESMDLSEEEYFDPRETHIQMSRRNIPIAKTTQCTHGGTHSAVRNSKLPDLPFPTMITATAVLFAYLFIPLPSFMVGLSMGILLTLLFTRLWNWWFKIGLCRLPNALPRLEDMPPLKVPEMIASKNEDGKFKVWMNELYQYNPEDYHISKTHSVYVQLEGTMLRLQRPKINVPKRTMWDDRPITGSTFVHQRHFNLVGANISVVPPGLVKKRLWSKKYPICIVLPNGGQEKTKKSKVVVTVEAALGFESVPEAAHENYLYLFARAGREKEAWFQRFDAASRGDPMPTRMSDLVKVCPTKTHATLDSVKQETEKVDNKLEIATDPKLLSRKSSPNVSSSQIGIPSLSPKFSSPDLATHFNEGSSVPVSTPSSMPMKTDLTLSLDDKKNTTVSDTGLNKPDPSKCMTPRPVDHNNELKTAVNKPIAAASATVAYLTHYLYFMAQLMPAADNDTIIHKPEPPVQPATPSTPSTSSTPAPTIKKDQKKEPERPNSKKDKKEKPPPPITDLPWVASDMSARWLNAILGRCFWDFLREDQWAIRVQQRIQRKLSKIHVPYIIDDLIVTDIDMGKETPYLRRISNPYLDDQGLWVDMDVAYNGGFTMSLETKVNLMKLKKDAAAGTAAGTAAGASSANSSKTSIRKNSPVTNSDEEDSAESSTDDDDEGDSSDERPEIGRRTSMRIFKLVDRISQSRYFQQATEIKYIKRAMEEVSNTPLQLTVGLHSLVGTVAINIPPPPTDRIWYGFRKNPKMWLQARPKVGTREVTVTHITEWIEKKLHIEFQRVFVLPNMDDMFVSFMTDELRALTPSPTSMMH